MRSFLLRKRVWKHGVQGRNNKKQKTSHLEAVEATFAVAVENADIRSTNFDIPTSTCPVEFQDSNATVCLEPGQMVSLDGSAIVCLLEGRGSMQGYSLTRDVQVLVYSCSKLCSALTFEGKCKLRFYSHNLEHPNDESLSFKLEFFEGEGSLPKADVALPKAEVSDSIGEVTRKRKMDTGSFGRRMRPTLVPSEWSVAADLILMHGLPVVQVCGDKGVGKSTFARFLVNKLLSRFKAVAYLDTDVGQPEFTISGCLSLHLLQEPIIGSPVSHLRDAERCFFYGDVTPKSDPVMYLNYFKDLYDYFQRHYVQDQETQAQVPLVINSPGWRSGVGYDILVDILRYAKATHVVEIESGDFVNTPDLSAASAASVLHIKSVSPHSDVKTAAQLRTLRVLSYFHRSSVAKNSCQVPAISEAAEALVYQVPYQISADDVNILHLHAEVPSSQCLYSLNAQLVGLAISSTAGSKRVPCVGFGIVRGVDAAARLLHIVTPCSPEVLENVDTILHGRVEIPAALLEVAGYVSPYLCKTRVLDGTGSCVLQRRQLNR